jgi:hypothetical protein
MGPSKFHEKVMKTTVMMMKNRPARNLEALSTVEILQVTELEKVPPKKSHNMLQSPTFFFNL